MPNYIAESRSEKLVLKAYASALIESTTEPDMSTDPGASGGFVLRHVSHNLSLSEDQYRPNEKRQDMQRPMGHGGSRTTSGTINGFHSPGTHKDLFLWNFRASAWAAAVATDYTDFTSVAADATSSKFTFTSGDPVTAGYRRGMIVRFSDLSASANNGVNYLILSFGGSNNREMTVYPAPTTMMADSAFSLTSVKTLTQPASAHTDWKVALEVYNQYTDMSRFYTECRVGGFDLQAGVNANVTLNFPLMGRNREILTGADAPYFSAPTAETTTDIPTSMDGLLRLNGATLGVATGLSLKMAIATSAAKVINPDGLVGGIFQEDAEISGEFTAFLDGPTLMQAFDDKTEMELFVYLPSTAEPDCDAACFYLPRVRLTSATEGESDGAKTVQCSFEAGRYNGSAAGVNSTTLQISDTAVA